MAAGLEAGGDDQVDAALVQQARFGNRGRRADGDDAVPFALRQHRRELGTPNTKLNAGPARRRSSASTCVSRSYGGSAVVVQAAALFPARGSTVRTAASRRSNSARASAPRPPGSWSETHRLSAKGSLVSARISCTQRPLSSRPAPEHTRRSSRGRRDQIPPPSAPRSTARRRTGPLDDWMPECPADVSPRSRAARLASELAGRQASRG